MNQVRLEEICLAINRKVGAEVSGELDRGSRRLGFKLWFSPLSKSEGPQFILMPSGLKRHTVTMQFGNYSRPCIEQIAEYAKEENYAYSRAIVRGLADDYSVEIKPSGDLVNWRTEPKLKISVTRKDVSGQHELNEIKKTSELIISPLVACMAELIGLEIQDDSLDNIEEGSEFYQLVKRRERNPRNRLLCLSIHPPECFVCKEDPSLKYGKVASSLLEVHHIEPLCEISQPRPYDPKADLILLCPNCHRAIHKRIPTFTPEELKVNFNDPS